MRPAGQSVPHESAAGLVTGSALYTDGLLARYRCLPHAWAAEVLTPLGAHHGSAADRYETREARAA